MEPSETYMCCNYEWASNKRLISLFTVQGTISAQEDDISQMTRNFRPMILKWTSTCSHSLVANYCPTSDVRIPTLHAYNCEASGGIIRLDRCEIGSNVSQQRSYVLI